MTRGGSATAVGRVVGGQGGEGRRAGGQGGAAPAGSAAAPTVHRRYRLEEGRLPPRRRRHRVPRHQAQRQGDGQGVGRGDLQPRHLPQQDERDRPGGPRQPERLLRASSRTARCSSRARCSTGSRSSKKKRGDYVQGSGTSNKTAVLIEALDKLTARDGKDALKGFDGFLFVCTPAERAVRRPTAGRPRRTTRTPARSRYQSRRYPYLLGAGGRVADDADRRVRQGVRPRARPARPGRPHGEHRLRGARRRGAPCPTRSPTAPAAAPLRLGKEKLGWLKPTVIDPTVKQKLILAPIEDSPKECFKVLVRPDGSEYFLLENRSKKGFDADLPGEGLLIWRVVERPADPGRVARRRGADRADGRT